MNYYKTLTSAGRGIYSGAQWETEAGAVMPALTGTPRECEWGYHLAREQNLGLWPGQVVLQVEPLGEVVEYVDKVATCGAVRIMRRGMLDVVAYAQWCADRAVAVADAARWAAAASWAAAAERSAQWIFDHIQWEEDR